MPRVVKGSMALKNRLPNADRRLALDRERAAAAASGLLVGVDEFEPLTHERLLPVEQCAVQIEKALRVHNDPHLRPVGRDVVEDAIAPLRRALVKLNHVGETRAAAAAQSEPQARLRRSTLLQLARDRVDRQSRYGDSGRLCLGP